MVATVLIIRKTNTDGLTTADITSINTRANTTDVHTTADIANPIQIPTDGATKRSYWVVTRLQTTVAPDTLIDNIEWFTDASNTYGTGIGNIGETATDYTQATGTAGDEGQELNTSNYSSLTTDPVDVFTFSSGTPNPVAGSTTDAEEFGDHMVFQVTVTSDAGAGVRPSGGPETFTWRFDET